MPINASPYKHQREAFEFACQQFGLLTKGGDAPPVSRGCAFLMEMG
jgi:hypothetical protein